MWAVAPGFHRDVAIDREFAASRLVGVELLQPGVAHRGQRVLGIAGAVDVALGDPHAEDRDVPPAVGARIKLWRLARLDPPHLLFAAAIILAIVGDAQRRRPRLVPVGEKHRKRAIAGRKRRALGIVRLVAGLRTEQRIVLAGAPRRARRIAVDVVSEHQRREFLALFPLGGERSRPAWVAVEAPVLVGELEGAVGAALEQQVLPDAQDDQVHMTVAVDVDRIGADDVVEQFWIGADI